MQVVFIKTVYIFYMERSRTYGCCCLINNEGSTNVMNTSYNGMATQRAVQISLQILLSMLSSAQIELPPPTLFTVLVLIVK